MEPVNQLLTFKIVDSASKRGKRKLIDSSGYGYNEKRQHIIATDWQCIVWPIARNCFFGQLNLSLESVRLVTCRLLIYPFSRNSPNLRGGAGLAQWWEHSPSTNVSRVRFPDSASYVGWVCWFSTLLREVFLRVLRFSPLLKNQHLIWFDLMKEL